MKFIIAGFTALFLSTICSAQSFKVIKIQGNKAIVQIDQPELVELNKTYNTGEVVSTKTKGGGGSFKRDNGIGLSFSFSNVKSDAPGATATELMSLAGTYLWNFKTFEVGPSLGFSNSKIGTTTSNSTLFGGVGFYNFNENKPGVEGIFSVYGALALGNSSGSTSETILQLGPNYRWFILSGDHCFNATAVYEYNKVTTGGVASTVTGFRILAGIATYF